jgi:hypothetical protein
LSVGEVLESSSTSPAFTIGAATSGDNPAPMPRTDAAVSTVSTKHDKRYFIIATMHKPGGIHAIGAA